MPNLGMTFPRPFQPYLLWRVIALLACFYGAISYAAPLELHTRSRVHPAGDTNAWVTKEEAVQWDPARTAIVICDMWDKHHCPDATERVGEMVPRMNETIKAARARGAFIIHCPSDTMDFYKGHPGRKLAQAAPKVETKVPLQGWCSLNGGKEPGLPIDDSDGGCDGCPDCPSFKAWTRQHPGLEVMDGDAITDSAEAFYLMRQRGITNVIVMGVHINMCVLGRPFSIRQMVTQGQNVLLMRDLTDSMYNHRKVPYVSHFRGTGLVVEHIEQYWCPSITSVDFLGGEPFQFAGSKPKKIVCVIGENEYHTWETLPDFAGKELAWRGYQVEYVTASPQVDDNDFKNWQAIASADLLVISTRRRNPPQPMMDAIRAHIAAAKPVVGIRTASHAFELRDQKEPTPNSWMHFDEEVLGADYQDHYGAGRATLVSRAAGVSENPILNGVGTEFRAKSHLYKSRDLKSTVVPLLVGKTEDGKSEVEPVAWINTGSNRRVFYTSLGSPDDFADANFRRLLLNGVLWSLGDFIPPAGLGILRSTGGAPPSAGASTPSTGVKDTPGTKGPLNPAEAAKSFKVADDLVWEQLLAEPTVAQPVFLTFDDRGRMWVVEYRQYPSPAGLKMVSHDNFWRAVYDKVPPPPPHHFRGADRITIHEDTDGDGTFDKHTTFVDGLNIATSVALGRGGVYVMNPPYLLFYPDKNRDDVPDGDPQVLLSGFGLEDTHSVANSLRWGPDGWLYGCQGSTVTGNILVYGADGQPLPGKPIFSQGQNIWRYHPEKRIYEVFSEGGGNAFGLEIDSAGRIFSGHNGGNTRGFHYMQGAYLQKGFDKHGPLSNPYAFGYFPQMPNNDAERFTHNFIIYDSGELGDQRQGKLFGVEPLQGRIVMSEITPEGSTFRTRDLGYPVTSSDPWFRPVDIKVGPDGAIYVCDWYDQQVNHYRNHEGQMDGSNGRIYRLRRKGSAAAIKPIASGLESWVRQAQTGNRWERQNAIRELSDLKDRSAVPALRAALHAPFQIISADGDGAAKSDARQRQAALGSLWALNALGELTESETSYCLNHWDPQVRLWTVRLLGDFKQVSPAISKQLSNLAGSEPDLEVRAQLACTARRLPPGDGLPMVRNLLAHDGDATDQRQPLLLWWAIEENCASHPEAVLNLFADRELWRAPIVQRTILSRLMRRFAAAGRREDLAICAKLFSLSPGTEQTAKLTQGFEEAYQGRPLAGMPEELLSAMERAGGSSILIGARRGQPAAVDQALAFVADPAADASKRLQLIQVFGEAKQDKAVPVLLALARDAKQQEFRKAAVGSLAAYDSTEVGREVLVQLPTYSGEVRTAAFALLASRPAWALALLEAVDRGAVDKAVVPRETVHRMRALAASSKSTTENPVRPKMADLLQKLYPSELRPTTAEMEREISRLGAVVNLTTGSPYMGKKLFLENCGVCHKLFGKGAEVGPDLTVFKRDDLGNLLLNIVNPNAEIREGYENFLVETKDGRSLTGFIADKDAQVVILRTPTGQSLPLQRTEILSMDPAGSSLMPEGLLTGLGDQQVRDLFAYLRSTQPLNDGN